jgi:hypothetical protein
MAAFDVSLEVVLGAKLFSAVGEAADEGHLLFLAILSQY